MEEDPSIYFDGRLHYILLTAPERDCYRSDGGENILFFLFIHLGWRKEKKDRSCSLSRALIISAVSTCSRFGLNPGLSLPPAWKETKTRTSLMQFSMIIINQETAQPSLDGRINSGPWMWNIAYILANCSFWQARSNPVLLLYILRREVTKYTWVIGPNAIFLAPLTFLRGKRTIKTTVLLNCPRQLNQDILFYVCYG